METLYLRSIPLGKQCLKNKKTVNVVLSLVILNQNKEIISDASESNQTYFNLGLKYFPKLSVFSGKGSALTKN